MAAEILSEDYREFLFAHSADTTAKIFLLINAFVVMAMNSALANVDNVFVYRAGAIRAPKATGEVWAPLDKIYWNDTNKNFTITVGTNTLAGYVVKDAATGDTEGIIDLDPSA